MFSKVLRIIFLSYFMYTATMKFFEILLLYVDWGSGLFFGD